MSDTDELMSITKKSKLPITIDPFPATNRLCDSKELPALMISIISFGLGFGGSSIVKVLSLVFAYNRRNDLEQV